MRRFATCFSLGLGLLVVALIAGCRAAPPPAPPAPEFRPTATVREVMGNMVDPSADVLWESVATIVSQEQGTSVGAEPERHQRIDLV